MTGTLTHKGGAANASEDPMFSIVVPVYNTPSSYLEKCVNSVLSQECESWQLILVDDASPKAGMKARLHDLAKHDGRISVVCRKTNGGISKATNDGLVLSRGLFTVFVDHDDELTSDALAVFSEHIKSHPEIDAIYSDQVKINATGSEYEHFYKPDWSPIYFIGVMYVGHLLAVRSSLIETVGGFNSDFDGVQDYEFMLRVSEHTDQIFHVRRPLYKWRAIPGSIAASGDAKDNIGELQRRAAESHIQRLGRSWRVEKHETLPHRLAIGPSERTHFPSISIVIPTRDQGLVLSACLDSIYDLTDYPDFEVVVVDNRTTDPVALDAMQRHPCHVVKFDRKFNFSVACNTGADASRGELLLFLNNDTEIFDKSWLKKLSCYFEDPEVGATGSTLLYPDKRVQHAGVVLGARGTADHVMRFFPPEVDGYAGSLASSREVSGVTAACLLMPRQLFYEIGQFSTDYNKHYQDVDLCLKIRERGYRIVNVANSRLIHHESISRKEDGYDMGDRAILIDRWYETIADRDPYYNEHLCLEKLDYSLRQLP